MSKPQLYPIDEHGHALTRAMGLPIVSDTLKIGGPNYVDLFDLSQYDDRIFFGIMVSNPDAVNRVTIAVGNDFNTNKVITVPPSGNMSFDNMTFGYGFVDPISNVRAKKIRALLSALSGILATATIVYAGVPLDGQCVFLNGKVYEFSNDLSKKTTSDFIVAIGATDDISYTNLRDVINLRVAGGQGEQAILASINIGTNTLTLTSEYGGTTGNTIPIADGDAAAANLTGSVFSGAFLGSVVAGLNGIQPIVTIW